MPEKVIQIFCSNCGKKQTALTRGKIQGYKKCVYCSRPINKAKNLVTEKLQQ